VASMKAVDVAPFQDELDQATHKHTVTFARASGINRIIPRPAQSSGSIRVPTAEQLILHPRRRGLFVAGTIGALIAGGTLAALLARPGHKPAIAMTQAPQAGVTAVGPPPGRPPTGEPVQVHTLTRDTLPARHVARPKGKVNKVVAPPPHQVAHTAHTPEQVQAKFRTIKSEYATFKA